MFNLNLKEKFTAINKKYNTAHNKEVAINAGFLTFGSILCYATDQVLAKECKKMKMNPILAFILRTVTDVGVAEYMMAPFIANLLLLHKNNHKEKAVADESLLMKMLHKK